MSLIDDVQPTLVSNRVLNVSAQNPTWSISQWDLGG